MPKTWKLLGLFASAITLVGCETYPCEKNTSQPGATVVSGGEQLQVTCASGAQHPVSVSSATFLQPSYSGDGLDVFFHAWNNADTQKQDLDFDIFIPRELADGSYPVGGADAAIRVTRRVDPQAQFQGTISFERTRNVPLVDVAEPEEDEAFTQTLKMTLNLTGKLKYDSACGSGSFSTGSMELHLERTSEVTTCTKDPGGPRLGH